MMHFLTHCDQVFPVEDQVRIIVVVERYESAVFKHLVKELLESNVVAIQNELYPRQSLRLVGACSKRFFDELNRFLLLEVL